MSIREGCSHGYWKAPQHLDSWVATGFSPTDIFNTVFGRPAFDSTITLLQSLDPATPVSKLEQLGIQATAALLNAAHPDINFPLTVAEVISMFQSAFDSGIYEPTKDIFDAYNNLFCPLN